MTTDERTDLKRRLAGLAAAIAEAEGAEGRDARHRLFRLERKADEAWADLGNLGAQMARTGGNR